MIITKEILAVLRYIYRKKSVSYLEYTTFQLDNLGIAEVEKAQWFNVEFFIKQILLPIVIAVVTTLLTLCLSS
ncbi:hypothetical protein AALH30_14110 [Blautia pseudococcoides]|uniref:hypothetical protein n=1 Tax=Blautia pseudococcoides TaxID=1796616 RepID=UPI00148B2B0F|nr:hypothetical protein [Blautia pseudococcoides]QJU15781.1 hypothetical protein HL650_15880 [Blautia pseudococcoides]